MTNCFTVQLSKYFFDIYKQATYNQTRRCFADPWKMHMLQRTSTADEVREVNFWGPLSVWPPTAWLKTTSRRCWKRKPCGMLHAASCRSTKVMALFAFSTTSITHSFSRATGGRSCSLQSPAQRERTGVEEQRQSRQRCYDGLKYDLTLEFSAWHNTLLIREMKPVQPFVHENGAELQEWKSDNTNFMLFKRKHESAVKKLAYKNTTYITLCEHDKDWSVWLLQAVNNGRWLFNVWSHFHITDSVNVLVLF